MNPSPTAPPAWQLELDRTFDAPIALVFEAWATPELWTRWFPPRGFTMTLEQMDFRVGGSFAATFHDDDAENVSHSFTGTYVEITPGERLVWEGAFPDGPPDQMLTSITFTAEGEKTAVHVVQSFRVLSPIAEMGIKGAKIGWGQTLDKLGEFLAERQTKA
ncbi:MAG: Activator of Hsp90 ATPase-like protein [Cyanobacteria bacterium RYN_339]|nr:Activator of Hsp90 ATPase-like protein [Cyanobacteria bacterium RYN_339]